MFALHRLVVSLILESPSLVCEPTVADRALAKPIGRARALSDLEGGAALAGRNSGRTFDLALLADFGPTGWPMVD